MMQFDGNYQQSIKDESCIFVLALTVNEILTFEIFNLKKIGQGHGLQLSEWHHFIANIKIYKRIFLHFLFSPRYDL